MYLWEPNKSKLEQIKEKRNSIATTSEMKVINSFERTVTTTTYSTKRASSSGSLCCSINVCKTSKMEEKDRATIKRNFVKLINGCRIDHLLPLLVEKNVFTPDMIKKYKDTNEDEKERNRKLFVDIQRRGPEAYNHLITSLLESDHKDLVHYFPISDRITVAKSTRHAYPFVLPTNENAQVHNPAEIVELAHSFNNCINLTTESFKVSVIHSTLFHDDQSKVPTYRTHSKNRGAVLIINNILFDGMQERRGADVDHRNLQDLFKQIGLSVEAHVNLKGLEMEKVINEFSQSPKLKYADMCIVVVMSHGNQENQSTYIVGTDRYGLDTLDIQEKFDNLHCPLLQNKPKVFIYQVCRGGQKGYGISGRIETDSAPRVTMRKHSDMLIAHATMQGYKSHRDIFLGTWYIEGICKVFMNHAHDTNLEDMLKSVDSILAKRMSESRTLQTSTYENQGFKRLYFHPGIYLEDGFVKKIFD